MKIAFALPKKDILTETFIQHHLDLLPGEHLVYHGGYIPTHLGPKKLEVIQTYSDRLRKRLGGSKAVVEWSYTQHAFLQSLERERPDVVLAEYGPTGAQLTPMLKKLNIPLVTHFHGYDASKYDVIKQFENAYKEMFNYAHALIAVSRRMESDLIQLGAPSSKVRYNCYGPKDLFLEQTAVFEKPVFLSVGRFVDKKAHHLAILAFHRFCKRHPQAQLVLIGEGPYKLFCEDIVKSLDLSDQVLFTGALPHAEVLQFMRSSLCFVQHSRRGETGDMEGTPLSILEAQAVGLPVVSTIHAGIPDVVLHEKTGLLVAENDIHGMANAMERIFLDQPLAKRMGAQGKERIATNFTLDRHIKDLQATLQSAIDAIKK
jgi:colanic acid/amylovoran biosynthesis glycosyltransferase